METQPGDRRRRTGAAGTRAAGSALGGLLEERSEFEARAEFRTHAGRVLARRNRRDLAVAETLTVMDPRSTKLLGVVMRRQSRQFLLIEGRARL